MKLTIMSLGAILIMSFNPSIQSQTISKGNKVKITTLSGEVLKGKILSKTSTNIEIQHFTGDTIPINHDSISMIELRKRGKAAFIRKGIAAGFIVGILYCITIEANHKERVSRTSNYYGKIEKDKPRPNVMLAVTLGSITVGGLIGAAIPYHEEIDFDEIRECQAGKLKPEFSPGFDGRGGINLSISFRF